MREHFPTSFIGCFEVGDESFSVQSVGDTRMRIPSDLREIEGKRAS
jgi:hypothetical protein